MKQPLIERWVEWVGRRAAAQPGGGWRAVVNAAILAVAFFLTYQNLSRSLDPCQWMVRDVYALALPIGAVWFLHGVFTSLEQAAFYRIIERQRARIRELEGQRQ